MNIAVLKDTAPGEHRIALLPGVVPGLIKLGGWLYMESRAAKGTGLADADFANVVVIAGRAVLAVDADVVICVWPPTHAVIVFVVSALGTDSSV